MNTKTKVQQKPILSDKKLANNESDGKVNEKRRYDDCIVFEFKEETRPGQTNRRGRSRSMQPSASNMSSRVNFRDSHSNYFNRNENKSQRGRKTVDIAVINKKKDNFIRSWKDSVYKIPKRSYHIHAKKEIR